MMQRQNGRHLADDIFKCIFVKENYYTSVQISLKFITRGPIDNDSALVQVVAWLQTGTKLLLRPR